MSKKDQLRIADYLNHMAEAIQRIQRYTANLSEADFPNDELVQDGVIRNIEIIGVTLPHQSRSMRIGWNYNHI